jgi:hypothetical protein
MLKSAKKALSRLLEIQYSLEKSCKNRIFMIFDFNGGHRIGKKVVRLALYAATAFFFVPNLMFFGSQEAVKKIWSKNRIFHAPEVVD